VTPEELREEARAAEFMARLVSYGRDKEWLTAKAAALRHQADLLEQRSWKPDGGGREPKAPRPPRR
jgi:hypothetical protein